MIKEIKYGAYLEDEAQFIFLDSLLPQLLRFLGLDNQYIFKLDEKFSSEYPLIAETGRNEFDVFHSDLCFYGISEFQQDVFFLGRDLDSVEISAFEERLQSIKVGLQKVCKDKTIILLPVQCTEYWFRYFKEIKKTKNQDLEQQFELQKKKSIKNNIYGSKNKLQRREILIELCQDMDIDFLAKKSYSFHYFLESVKNFLQE